MNSTEMKMLEHAIAELQDVRQAICQSKKRQADYSPIGEQIRTRRHELMDMGNKVNYPDIAYLSRVETGVINPTLRKLTEICDVIDCHIEIVPNNQIF